LLRAPPLLLVDAEWVVKPELWCSCMGENVDAATCDELETAC
jgi:hypothetical protein